MWKCSPIVVFQQLLEIVRKLKTKSFFPSQYPFVGNFCPSVQAITILLYCLYSCSFIICELTVQILSFRLSKTFWVFTYIIFISWQVHFSFHENNPFRFVPSTPSFECFNTYTITVWYYTRLKSVFILNGYKCISSHMGVTWIFVFWAFWASDRNKYFNIHKKLSFRSAKHDFKICPKLKSKLQKITRHQH